MLAKQLHGVAAGKPKGLDKVDGEGKALDNEERTLGPMGLSGASSARLSRPGIE